MCGRYTLTADLKKVADRFGAPPLPDWGSCTPQSLDSTHSHSPGPARLKTIPGHLSTSLGPRYNIAPAQSVIVVGDDGKRFLKPMRWGMIPSWAKDPSIGNRMINARAETLAEKPAFRAALKKRRCLIPADGFYEWQKLGQVKQPVRIVLKSREPFGFAGLWEQWMSPDGEGILSCTIITTEANELLKPIHNRMPVILMQDVEAVWLDPKIQEPEKLLPLLRQHPSDELEFYPVSREVNSPAVDKPSNIEPINTEQSADNGSSVFP
jgi:putative SOS response-associated peptidase YedK